MKAFVGVPNDETLAEIRNQAAKLQNKILSYNASMRTRRSQAKPEKNNTITLKMIGQDIPVSVDSMLKSAVRTQTCQPCRIPAVTPLFF